MGNKYTDNKITLNQAEIEKFGAPFLKKIITDNYSITKLIYNNSIIDSEVIFTSTTHDNHITANHALIAIQYILTTYITASNSQKHDRQIILSDMRISCKKPIYEKTIPISFFIEKNNSTDFTIYKFNFIVGCEKFIGDITLFYPKEENWKFNKKI